MIRSHAVRQAIRATACVWLPICVFVPAANAQNAIVTQLTPGDEKSVWDGANVSGKVYLVIDGGPGSDCVKLRWKRMWSIVGSSWTACDRSEVDAMVWLHYAQLLAGAATRPVAIAVTDDVGVAAKVTLCDQDFSDCLGGLLPGR